MPGSEGSKAAIPTPKIRADPSHLEQGQRMYMSYDIWSVWDTD